MKDRLGFVHLRGVAKAVFGSTYECGPPDPGSGGIIFVLPSGYRPVNQEAFSVDNTNKLGRVDVKLEGSVCSRVSTPTDGFVTLDGITFRAAQ